MKKEEKKDEVISLNTKVIVYSTDKDKHHETGTPFKVHPKVAESIIERGLATAEAPASKKGKGKDDDITI